MILSGLRARPDNAGVDMFVTAGSVLVVAPDAVPNPDDCPVKLIHDDGVILSGALTLTAGDAVSARVDVIEFSVTEEAQEFDNRNIWDENTAQFVPTQIVKVSRQKLAWRIRVGVAGAGFPGVVADWCPVCVAVVQPLATTWATVTLWDVRPLANDLVESPHDDAEVYRRHYRAQGRLNYDSGAALLLVQVETEQGGRKAGGEILIAPNSATYREPGHAPASQALWYLWLAFPFGLPRWCQYTSAFASRTPGALRGIPVISSKPVGPATGYVVRGEPQSAVAIPASFNLGGSTSDCALALVGVYDATPKPMTMALDGRRTYLGSPGKTAAFPGLTVNESATFNSDTDIPGCATSLLLRSTFVMSFAAAVERTGVFHRTIEWKGPVAAGDPAAAALGSQVWKGPMVFADLTEAYTDVYETWVPMAPALEIVGPIEHDVEYTLFVDGNFAAPVVSSCFVTVLGWELSP